MKSPKLGTVWVARAKVQIIDESTAVPRWRTLAVVIDTPRHVGEAVTEFHAKGVGGLWVLHVECGQDREYVG